MGFWWCKILFCWCKIAAKLTGCRSLLCLMTGFSGLSSDVRNVRIPCHSATIQASSVIPRESSHALHFGYTGRHGLISTTDLGRDVTTQHWCSVGQLEKASVHLVFAHPAEKPDPQPLRGQRQDLDVALEIGWVEPEARGFLVGYWLVAVVICQLFSPFCSGWSGRSPVKATAEPSQAAGISRRPFLAALSYENSRDKSNTFYWRFPPRPERFTPLLAPAAREYQPLLVNAPALAPGQRLGLCREGARVADAGSLLLRGFAWWGEVRRPRVRDGGKHFYRHRDSWTSSSVIKTSTRGFAASFRRRLPSQSSICLSSFSTPAAWSMSATASR